MGKTINNFYFVDSKGIGKKLAQIQKGIEAIQKGVRHMSKELDDLEVAVQENTDLDGSIIQLVDGLAAQIESQKTDPVKLQAMAVSLRAKSAAIAAAIQANTPAVS